MNDDDDNIVDFPFENTIEGRQFEEDEAKREETIFNLMRETQPFRMPGGKISTIRNPEDNGLWAELIFLTARDLESLILGGEYSLSEHEEHVRRWCKWEGLPDEPLREAAIRLYLLRIKRLAAQIHLVDDPRIEAGGE